MLHLLLFRMMLEAMLVLVAAGRWPCPCWLRGLSRAIGTMPRVVRVEGVCSNTVEHRLAG
jgi:hypothetical protein